MRPRIALNVTNRNIKSEAEATIFTQNDKLLWIIKERINKFLDEKEWKSSILYTDFINAMNIEVYSPKHNEYERRPSFNTIIKNAKWRKCEIGETFGPSWSTHWFKIALNPKSYWLIEQEKNNKEIHLLWNSNSESTLWNENGICLQGLTSEWEQKREEYMFDKTQKFPLIVYIEMACNHRFGNGQDQYKGIHGPPQNNTTFKLQQCELALFNRKAWNLMWDLKVLNQIITQNSNIDKTQILQILREINNILNEIDLSNDNTFDNALKRTNKLLYNNNGDIDGDDNDGDDNYTIYLLGNCHIDTAWLWPYCETRRKIIRSWSSQLRLMELYNNINYHFTASQAIQYSWLKEDCNELYERIKLKIINNKQWHIVGGTWVEMDGNLPSGESFIRQFLYGQEFYMNEFNKRCKIFWLPDTFGYSGQLPQIIRQSGIKYFLTQKLSWNLINKFPHHSFIWEGIDGSSILTHFPPSDTYVSQCNINDIIKSKINYKNKSCNNESLLLYGWGDGGGGPTTMHLERIKRYTKNHGINGLPKVKMSSPLEFFDKLSESAHKLPTYVGELYFELHRGTFTTNALIKSENQTCESLLQFAEFIYCLLFIKSEKKIKYPLNQFDKLWKLVLLNQFHDVLPGTSIEITNIDARNIYNQVFKDLTTLIDNGLIQCFKYFAEHKSKTESYHYTQSTDSVMVINSKSWTRKEILKLNIDQVLINQDKISQLTHDNNTLIMVQSDSYSLSILTPLKINDIFQHPMHDKIMVYPQITRNYFLQYYHCLHFF